ncbi:hypothetical protein KDX23_07295 [Burkholderia vietnamiensis]|uniref:hypothetical protein n=1 Tax=Burkholderia vietnamiensis TaxID=60552 RepID=UPI001BA3E30F|nr:hypothetical protein [Burkholderia vietnamiensis]MBR8082548.1 hypothetical protein [Burkholderia vietnamiensis]
MQIYIPKAVVTVTEGILIGLGLVFVAGLLIVTIEDAVKDNHTVREALIGHDSDGHKTLNGVALGMPLDDAMPACQGDPQSATALCHTPLTRTYDGSKELKADVYGFGARKDDDGHPTVTSMTVTTNIDSTVIKDVTAYTTRASAYATFLQTSQVLGTPTRVDDYYTSWDLAQDQTVLLNTTSISLYRN